NRVWVCCPAESAVTGVSYHLRRQQYLGFCLSREVDYLPSLPPLHDSAAVVLCFEAPALRMPITTSCSQTRKRTKMPAYNKTRIARIVMTTISTLTMPSTIA